METKESGGFEDEPQKCSYCSSIFRVTQLPPFYKEEDITFCPYCGNNLHDGNELSDDELLKQIEEAENR